MNAYTEILKIYLDACCLLRFFDDPTQERVRNEKAAIALILSRVHTGPWSWVASKVLIDEVDEGSYPAQRDRINKILTYASQTVSVGAMEIARAKHLVEALGLKREDALHLACAESGAADIFLTTDDRLLKTARADPQIHLRVENPHTWLMGVTENEHTKNANAGDA